LPGGGVALLRAVKALARLKGENEDQRHGIEIVKNAITRLARQIAINAGEDGSVVVGKILERDTYATPTTHRPVSMPTLCLRASSIRRR
jgi:chaperonin GroEL